MATTDSEPTTTPTTKQQIDELLDMLSPRDQARVLAYARSLNELPEGVSGQELVDFFHEFAVSPEEAEAMTRIYEEIGVLRDSSEQ